MAFTVPENIPPGGRRPTREECIADAARVWRNAIEAGTARCTTIDKGAA